MHQSTIALLHYAALPTLGGVETTLGMHAHLFAQHGYSVRVLTGAGEVTDPRVPVVVIGDVGSRSPRVMRANGELARGVISGEFCVLVDDLVHAVAEALDPLESRPMVIAHNAVSLHKNLALTAALARLVAEERIRLIAWCHDLAWTDPQYERDLHDGFPWDLLRFPWVDTRYVVVSEARKNELLGLWESFLAEPTRRGGAGRLPGAGDDVCRALSVPAVSSGRSVAVVPPGVDPLAFLGVTQQTRDWVLRFGLLDADPLLLLPARLTRRKNIEYAIAIVAELRTRGLPAKLLVTGPPGPHNPTNAAYLDRLRSTRHALGVTDAVLFLHEQGPVDVATLRDLYLLSDALLFPSEREGFGIPLLEAGLTRLPIFCSDLAPFRETAGKYGHYWAPDQGPGVAAELIVTTLERDGAARLRRRVMRDYSWERIFDDRIEPLVSGNDLPG